MSAAMNLRQLYLPADTSLNTGAATDVIQQLCRHASAEELRILLDHAVIEPGLPPGEDWTSTVLAAHTPSLRAAAEHALLILLGRFARSLTRRDVTCYRLGPDRPWIDAYATGGLSSGEGESPTVSFDDWDLVEDTDRFPANWPGQIGAAAGLLHPWGDGSAVTTVQLRAWA